MDIALVKVNIYIRFIKELQMKSFKYLPIAAALSVLTTSTFAAYAPMGGEEVIVKEFKIEVDADTDKGAHIMVDSNGNHSVVELPKDALNDPEQIDAALADLPEETREKVKKALSGIHMDGEGFSFQVEEDVKKQWVSKSDNEHVIIVDIENEGDINGEVVKKIIKKIGHGEHGDKKVFEFKHGKISAESIVHLLKKGEFSSDDLNKIQQALDEKR